MLPQSAFSMQAAAPQELAIGQDHKAQVEVSDWRANCTGNDDWLRGPRSDDWWTGPKPNPDKPTTSLPLKDLSQMTREDMLANFQNSWELTEALFAGLQGEEPFMTPPYHDLRHPLIFYYGHSACFYVNKLRVAGLLDGPVNNYFESIFEVGVDEMRWDDINKNHMEWPSVDAVHEYRREVYKTVCRVIKNAAGFETLATDLEDSDWWAVPMCIAHERIHLETSSVLMRELPISYVAPPSTWPSPHPARSDAARVPQEGKDYPPIKLRYVEGGTVPLGKSRSFPTYGWDNEYGHQKVQVGAFEASECLITNGEYLEFVKAGGYSERSYWSETGWGWRCFRNALAPTFWESQGPRGFHDYKLRTVFEEIAMPWDWPAIVNYHEARAYCAWKDEPGKLPLRVITESEHWLLRSKSDKSWGAAMASSSRQGEGEPAMKSNVLGDQLSPNLNLAHGSEGPVNAADSTDKGFHDVMGNVWEWCEDHQCGLPGFKVHLHYEDFTMPCFDGEHNLIMGGSFASTGELASQWGRYQFRPHFFQHAGFRVCRPVADTPEDPWLVTSCMDNEGPFATGGTSPFRTRTQGHLYPQTAAQNPLSINEAEVKSATCGRSSKKRKWKKTVVILYCDDRLHTLGTLILIVLNDTHPPPPPPLPPLPSRTLFVFRVRPMRSKSRPKPTTRKTSGWRAIFTCTTPPVKRRASRVGCPKNPSTFQHGVGLPCAILRSHREHIWGRH